jgi:hypothetical protein
MRQFRQTDGQHGAAGAEIQRIARMFTADDSVDHFKATGRRAVMAGAESQACLDLDGDIAYAPLVAVMRAVHKKTPGPNRLKPFQRFGHPIDVR